MASTRNSRDLAVMHYTSTGGAAVLKQSQRFEGIVALVVGKEAKELVLSPVDSARTVPQIFKPTYLLGNLGPRLNKDELSDPQKYLLSMTQRAGDYANVPDQIGVSNYFMAIARAYHEGAKLNPKLDVWTTFRHTIALDIRTKIVEGGVAFARKIVRHDPDWEVAAPQQMALTERVLQMFGLSIERVAQEELYSFVDLYGGRCSAAASLAETQGNEDRVRELRNTYRALTAALHDPKPLRASHHHKGTFTWS